MDRRQLQLAGLDLAQRGVGLTSHIRTDFAQAALQGDDPPIDREMFGRFRNVQRMIRDDRWKRIEYPHFRRVSCSIGNRLRTNCRTFPVIRSPRPGCGNGQRDCRPDRRRWPILRSAVRSPARSLPDYNSRSFFLKLASTFDSACGLVECVPARTTATHSRHPPHLATWASQRPIRRSALNKSELHRGESV